jgi:hypothetical protein
MEQETLAVLAAALVFVTVFLLVTAFLSHNEDPVQARIASLRSGSRQEDLPDLARPFGERVLGPALDSVAERILAILPQSMMSSIKKKLVLAGEPMNLGGFLTVLAASGGVFLVLGFTMMVASGRPGNYSCWWR